MSLKKLFSTLLIILIVVLLLLLLFSVVVGYENTISTLINYFTFNKYELKIKLLVTKTKFYCLQWVIFIWIFTLFFVLKHKKVLFNIIKFYLKDLLCSFLNIIKVLNNKFNVLAILLPFLTIIYYAINLPISYDEAWTYLNFSSRNFLVSLTYYPAPNNHILHSLLTNFTNFIFPNSPLLSLRLPTIIVSFLTYLIGIYSIKKHYNHTISLATVGLFSVLFMGIYYGYMSRGYALVVLFFIISYHFSLNIIKNPDGNRNWVWLTIFSAFGFFTMPSYLYAFIILNSVILFFNLNKNCLIKQIKFASLTVVIVVILYLPAIIVSGLNSLINNKYITPKSKEILFDELPDFLFETSELIVGLNLYFILSIILILLFYLFKNKDWFHLKLFALLLITPPLLLIVHSVIPFSRTFNYYGFIFILFFCISIQFLLKKVKAKSLVIIIICIQISFIYNFKSKIYNYEKYSILAQEINSKIIKENNSYLVNSALYDTYLFYSLKVTKTINYTVDYSPIINMSADSISKYNYIIIDKNLDKTKTRKPIFSNDFITIYE